MDQIIRDNYIIYIGGNQTDYKNLSGVNITHLGNRMSPKEHRFAIVYCFGIEFILYKGSVAFETIYNTFIKWQEKLYYCSDREEYKKTYNDAKIDLENLTITVAINYVSAEDIRNYIVMEKEKSYREGYNKHKKELREVFGF